MGQWCSASGFDREGCCCLSEIWLSSEIVSADWTTLAECSPKATHISALLLGFNSWRNEKRKRSLLNCLYLIPHSNSWVCVCVCMRVFLFFSAVNVHDIALHRMNDWIASVHADKWAIKPRFLYISVRYQSHYCLFEFWQLIMSLLIQICFLIWINKVYQSTHHSTGTQIHSTKSNSFFVPRLNIFRHTQISSFFIYLAILSLIKPLWEVITLTIKEDVIWSFYCQVVHNDNNAPSPAALYNVLGETSQWFVCVSVCTHTCVHFSFGFVIKEY